MHRARTETLRLAIALLLLGLVPAATTAADRSVIHVPFAATASSSEARGWLTLRITPATGAELSVRAEGLEPGRLYAVRLGDVRGGVLRADDRGTIDSAYPLGTSPDYRPALEKDPRDGPVSLAPVSGVPVLVGNLRGSTERRGSRYVVRAALSPTSVAPSGARATVHAAYRPEARSFGLALEGLPAGRHVLLVDGRRRATVEVRSAGQEARVEFSTPAVAGARELDFDPRGRRVEVRGARGRLFEGVVRARIPQMPPKRAERVSFTVVIPDFVSKRVEGVTLWRREDGGARWRRAARIRVFEGPAGEFWYRAFDARMEEPVGVAHRTRAGTTAGGDGRIVTFEYERSAPSARFKVSTFNSAGESPRSHVTARR